MADNGWSISSNYQNYKNIIKEISLEAEKNKKEIHFIILLQKNLKNQRYLNPQKLLSFWIIIRLFSQNSLHRKLLHKTLHSMTISKNLKSFYLFST